MPFRCRLEARAWRIEVEARGQGLGSTIWLGPLLSPLTSCLNPSVYWPAGRLSMRRIVPIFSVASTDGGRRTNYV
jgi:hypothetical protein